MRLGQLPKQSLVVLHQEALGEYGRCCCPGGDGREREKKRLSVNALVRELWRRGVIGNYIQEIKEVPLGHKR